MVRVPRYGIHNGVKYGNKRTLVRLCIKCNKYFIPTGRRDEYCKVCRINRRRENLRNSNNKRKPRKEYIRIKVAESRANGNTKTKETIGTTNIPGKPNKNWSDKEWMESHNKWKKTKQETMGGYVDYHDMDEYEEY